MTSGWHMNIEKVQMYLCEIGWRVQIKVDHEYTPPLSFCFQLPPFILSSVDWVPN